MRRGIHDMRRLARGCKMQSQSPWKDARAGLSKPADLSADRPRRSALDLGLPARSTEKMLLFQQAAVGFHQHQRCCRGYKRRGARVTSLTSESAPICLFLSSLLCLSWCVCVYTGRSRARQDSILFSIPCCVSRYEGINI